MAGTKVERGSEHVLLDEVVSVSLTTPLVIGGTGTTSDLTLKTTSGVAASGADMTFATGNNGALTAGVINYEGTSTWGCATSAAATTVRAGTGALTVTAGGIFDVNAVGAVTIDSNATFSLDGVGASNVTATSGNLTLSTLTSGNVVVSSVAALDVDSVAATVDASGGFSIDGSGAACNVSATSQNLTLSTITGGNVVLTSAALLDVDAAANIDVDVTGTFDMLSTGAFSIDGTGASNVSATSGNLTLSTITSGTLAVTGIAALDMDGTTVTLDGSNGVSIDGAGAASNLSSTSQNLTVSTISSGTLAVASAGTLDMDGVAVALDASNGFSIDGAGAACNVSATSQDLTLSTITSGTLAITGAALLDIDSGANIDIDTTGTFDVLSTGAFSVDGTGASNVTATSGNLTLSTLTSGNVVVSSIAALDMDGVAVTLDASNGFSIDGAGAASNLSSTSQNLTVSTITSGTLAITGAALLDIDAGANLDCDVTGTVDVTATSTITIDGTTTTIEGVEYPTLYTALGDPTGFPTAGSGGTLSWNDGLYTFTITGAHDIYIDGVKTAKATGSIQIADVTGLYYIYYNASGVLSSSTNHPGYDIPQIATVYWNTTTDKGLLCEERHGISMDAATMQWAHDTIGARYVSGAAGTFGDSSISIADGSISDEDLVKTWTTQTTCNVLYKNGDANWEWDAAATVPYKMNGANMRYNSGNNLADAGANQYVANWVFATNDTTTPIYVIIGQYSDATIAAARSNNLYENLSLGTLPSKEMKVLYRVIYRNTGAPPTYVEAQDFRSVSNVSSGTYVATDHGVLSGLADDDHTIYALLAGRTGGQTFIGGTGTTDDAIIRATSGVGASGSDIIFQVGNNGGTEAGRFLYDGTLQLGANSITMTGSLADTTNRVAAGFFTDLTVTNPIAGSITGNAATVTLADTTSATCSVCLVEGATGAQGIKSDASIVYNASTGNFGATSFNKITLTTPANGSTFTLTDAKTFAVTNTITLSGTDSTVITLPTATSTVLANNLGIAGGSTLIGGTAAGEDLTLSSTSHGTKGSILVSDDIDVAEGKYYRYGTGIFAYAQTALHNYYFGSAGNLTTTGTYNTVGGDSAGIALAALAHGNTMWGASAGYNSSTGTYNVFVGMEAGYGSGGVYAGSNYNTAVGYRAGYDLGAAAVNNTIVGALAGENLTTGDSATLVGSYAGASYTVANEATAFGYYSLKETSGAWNTACGYSSGARCGTGNGNTFLGNLAGYGSSGVYDGSSYNTILGYYAGFDISAAALNNTLVGAYAGQNLTTADGCVLIGYKAGNALTTEDNKLYIANSDSGAGSVLITGDFSTGNVGIGLAAWGTSAAKVIGLASGTAPTTSPVDAVQLWSADRNAVAGTAGLHVRSENGNSYVLADACGFGTVTPSTFAEFSHAGTATATYDMVALTNTVNAADMTATGTAILFNQWYYDAATPAVADAGRVAVITEGNWTSDGATHDAVMSLQVALNGTITERVTINSAGLIRPTACAGAAQDHALLIGAGTSADPATWSTADKSAVEFRAKSTATTGTAYGVYVGMEAATTAEHIPMRGRTYLTGTTGNAHGGHFTLEDDATNGKVTGLGTGLRANWVLGNAAQEAGGTYYGALAEIYANGNAADPSAVTRYACLGIGANGDATAAAKVKNAIDFHSTGADATTNMIYTHSHAPGDAAGSIRILVNGVAKYVKFYDAE